MVVVVDFAVAAVFVIVAEAASFFAALPFSSGTRRGSVRQVLTLQT